MSWAEKVHEADTVEGKLRVLAEAIDWLGAAGVNAPVVMKALAKTVPCPKEAGVKDAVESVDALSVFNYWREKIDRPQAKFSPERRRSVKARLKDGYAVEFIFRAIDGCAGSDFHMARGQYVNEKPFNDLTLICRNGSKLEWFEGLDKHTGPSDKFLGGAA